MTIQLRTSDSKKPSKSKKSKPKENDDEPKKSKLKNFLITRQSTAPEMCASLLFSDPQKAINMVVIYFVA